MSGRPSIFAHAHGFLTMEQWIPAEIYMSSIYEPDRVIGTAVDLRHVVFPDEDTNFNLIMSRYRSGIYYPPNFHGMQLAALPEYLQEVHKELGGGTIAVRDYDIKFFLEYARVRPVVNAWFFIPKLRELNGIPGLPINIHENVHYDGAKYLCSKLVAWKYAHFFKYMYDY